MNSTKTTIKQLELQIKYVSEFITVEGPNNETLDKLYDLLKKWKDAKARERLKNEYK